MKGKSEIIGVVGPCAAGKSTLIAGLIERGFQVKHIAQEHSIIPDMWQRLTKPDILIYLDVSYSATKQRQHINWTPEEYAEQQNRLRHARTNNNVYLRTDNLTPEEVLQHILTALRKIGHTVETSV